MTTEIELREPQRAPRRLQLNGAIDVGREGVPLIIEDPTVSRRHAQLTPVPEGVIVSDLGSANGTWVDGAAILEPVLVRLGGSVRLGGTELVVVSVDQVAPPPPEARQPAAPRADPRRSLVSREVEGGFVLLYRPGSEGERAAPSMADALRRGRRRLKGLGSEPWGTVVRVLLVDPFPEPTDPSRLVTSGSIVDTRANEIWMVVSAEAPPESPERALAVVFGAALPAAAQLGVILDGYGLHLAQAENPDRVLRNADLPPFDEASGELASAMALSFVRLLIERGGTDSVRQLLTTSKAGGVEAAAQDIFGVTLTALEEEWRMKLFFGQERVNPRQFVRLSLRYLRPHARKQAEIGLYMLFGLAFTITLPFVTKRLFDTAIPSGEFSEVATLLLILGAAFGVSLLAGLRQAYVSAYVGGAIVRDIRAEMFDRLQALSVGWFSRRQQGDILSRMFNDVAILEAGISQTLREGLFQVLTLVVSGVIMLRLNLLLGVVVLIGAPIVALIYRLMTNGAQRRSIALQERHSALLGIAAENYSAQPVVKAFGLEQHEHDRFNRALQRLFVAERRLSLFGGLFGLSVNLVVTLLRLGVLGLGAWLVLDGQLTLGALVAFLGIMGEVIGPVTNLTGLGQEIQTSTGALVRINEILEQEPDIPDAPDAIDLPPLQHEIRLSGITFGYTPDRRTLDGIDIVIPFGARVAFVGPSGAGKSSILQLLLRSYDPDDGSVLFDGRDARSVSLASLRRQLGVVFQDTFLFDTSIRENIAMCRPGASDADVEAAARGAEVHDFIMALPHGYDTIVGERGGRLSGGQRQRVAIARALVRDPSVLLLDEATSALDPRTERLINSTLEQAAVGRTTIAVTHRLTSVVDYDRIYVVVDGRIAESGRHAELLAAGGVYAGLWAEQTGTPQPSAIQIDLRAAVGRLPFFTELAPPELASVVEQFRSMAVEEGRRIPEGGALYVVGRGKLEVEQPGVGGGSATVARLGPGDAFGVAALLGEDRGSEAVAVESAVLLVLDASVLSALAARLPEVAAVLQGRGIEGPGEGRRLSRITIGPRLDQSGEIIVPIAPHAGRLSVRMTGSFRPDR